VLGDSRENLTSPREGEETGTQVEHDPKEHL